MKQPEITVYGAHWCPDCRRSKQFLGEHQRRKMDAKKLLRAMGLALILSLVIGCSAPTTAPTPIASTVAPTPTDEGIAQGLSDNEVATLNSLERVDDYPLYIMRYYGAYETASLPAQNTGWFANTDPMASSPGWACSLFAALGDTHNRLYGRNFDWDFSPAVLLFTDPPDGYASVSMVDIAYLFESTEARTLTDLPLSERRPLLNAPFWPFDGMNEHGLAIGMAAVPESDMPHDPSKESIDSLGVIREMLDHARNVDEAVAILDSYNIHWAGGPPLHYLIADASGRSVLVEFYEGERVLIENEAPWHLATNFLRTASKAADGGCWRYARIHERLEESNGYLTPQDAIDLLEQASQEETQWSVVYEINTGDANAVMGQHYDNVLTFNLIDLISE